MNLIIIVLYLLVIFFSTVLIYKFAGMGGLFIWIVLNLIVCNIQSVKTIEIFGHLISLGNISYSAIFLSTDILNEKYGVKVANKSVYVGFAVIFIFLLAMQITILFIPSNSDISQKGLEIVFNMLPRITIASLLAYVISQKMDTWLYNYLKLKKCKLWVRNNVSTIISQIFDSVLFVLISFLGVFTFHDCLDLIFTMIFFKTWLAIFDTPFMYIANSIKNANELL